MAQYVITDGTRWIMRDRHGRYVPTSCEALADVFSNKQATGIFQSNLSKALKSVFRVQKIDEPPKLIKQISQETVQENTEKVSAHLLTGKHKNTGKIFFGRKDKKWK